MFFKKKEKKNYLVKFRWNFGHFEERRTVQAKSKNEAISKIIKEFYKACEILAVTEVTL